MSSTTSHDEPSVGSMVARARRGLVWYLKQATGEAKWEEYVARCDRDGVEPMTRREYERHRADHRERNPQSRCC